MRRTVRRLGGLLGSLLVLNLSLVTGDLPCARHAAALGEPAGTVTHDAHAGHHGHASHPAAASHRADVHAPPDQARQPCKTPSRANCCEALTSCQVQMVFAGSLEMIAASTTRPSMLGSDAELIAPVPSPDTPPPKAQLSLS
jgi:hypothetical protein